MNIIQWRPVSELPEIGERILLATPSSILTGQRTGVLEESEDESVFVNDINLVIYGVKFWAKLPDVPTHATQCDARRMSKRHVTHSERQLIEALQSIREILNARDRNDIENEVFHVASNALCQSSCDAQFKTVDFDSSLNELNHALSFPEYLSSACGKRIAVTKWNPMAEIPALVTVHIEGTIEIPTDEKAN